MSEEKRLPQTAREAFLIELIGDLGVIGDQIKSLPGEINQAVSGSLEIIASSVEEAEKTASELSQAIERQKTVALAEFRESVKSSLDEHAHKTFSELEKSVNKLQKRVDGFELADPKSRRLNVILACTLAITLALSGAAIYGIYSGAQSTISALTSQHNISR